MTIKIFQSLTQTRQNCKSPSEHGESERIGVGLKLGHHLAFSWLFKRKSKSQKSNYDKAMNCLCLDCPVCLKGLYNGYTHKIGADTQDNVDHELEFVTSCLD
eukprot:NODE_538_length_6306_cov_1.301273.p4 type:complete len:102 gc:universal NODE_538_length_6306_cov_1.301273:6035-5730(-)